MAQVKIHPVHSRDHHGAGSFPARAMSGAHKTVAERDWGNVTGFLSGLGLTGDMLQKIGTIAVLASNTEYWTERAIWRISGINPAGIRPSTDAQPISALIEQLKDAGSALPSQNPELQPLLDAWCGAACPAFHCRNSIFHGITVSMGDTAWFAKNPRWEGETRKRPFSDFHADEHTLSLLQTVFGVLFRGIVTIERRAINRNPNGDITQLIAALKNAKSIALELENLAAAVNDEKY